VTFLSTRRRHPLAGLVVVLFGLVIAGGLYAAFVPAQAQSTVSDDQLIEQGRHLFVVGSPAKGSYCRTTTTTVRR
jgi:quinol---cytochrome-c reductase cytochrome c subunit